MNSTIRRAAWRAGLILLLGLLISPAAWATLTFDDVVRLVSAGVTEETILDLADVEGATFDLTVEQVIELKEVGATEEFIRALMATPEEDVEDRAYDTGEDERAVGNAYDDYDLEDYSTVFLYHYYDPFAYYWYAWPSYYVYYSPFWWSRAGFYYGGAWCWDWWDPWGPCSWYCDDHFGYQHWFGPSRTRPDAERDWHRMRSAYPDRAERERSVWQRAGLVRPAGLTARSNPTWRDAARVRTQALRETGRERQTIRTENRTRRVRGESSSPSRRTYRDRSSDRQRPGTERGIQRERSSAPQRQSSSRSSRGVRSGEATRSGRSESGSPSSPSPPSGSSDSRQETRRPGRGR
jgi:hypothetical protein